jgi:hypothetical protein
MPLQTRLSGLITAIGADIKDLRNTKAEKFHAGTHGQGGTDPVNAGSIGALQYPPVHSPVTRSLNTTYQPSTASPVLVVITIIMSVSNSAKGYILVKVGSDNPPTQVIARPLLYSYGAQAEAVYIPITFLVPKAFRYRLDSVVVQGSPTLNVEYAVEQML